MDAAEVDERQLPERSQREQASEALIHMPDTRKEQVMEARELVERRQRHIRESPLATDDQLAQSREVRERLQSQAPVRKTALHDHLHVVVVECVQPGVIEVPLRHADSELLPRGYPRLA